MISIFRIDNHFVIKLEMVGCNRTTKGLRNLQNGLAVNKAITGRFNKSIESLFSYHFG